MFVKVLRKGGLQRKIFVLMLAVGVFPGLVGVTAVYFMGNRLVMQSVGPGLIGTAEKAASEVDTIFRYELSHAVEFAGLRNIREFTEKANERRAAVEKSLTETEKAWESRDAGMLKAVLNNEVAVFLNSIMRDPAGYCHIMIVDKSGKVVAATDYVRNLVYSGEAWWQEAMNGKPWIGGSDTCLSGKKERNFFYAVPIFGLDNKAKTGVLYVERKTEAVLSSLKHFRFGRTGHLEIVDSQGKYIIEAFGVEEAEVPRWLLDAIASKDTGWDVGIDEHGNKAAKGFAPAGVSGWHVVLSQELSEIYAPLNALMWGASLPGFLTVVILALIWFNISKRMVLVPISKLSEGAYRIGHGELDHRLNINTNDELEELAHEFNTMAENLGSSQEKLRRWNEELQEEVAKRTSELEEANEELYESKEELQDSLNQVMALNEQLQENKDELRKRNDDLAGANMKLREIDRLKSEFLANMSHELRTPLTAIIGFSELLIDKVMGELNEDQAGCLDNVLTSGQHLLKLINDILDLSKIEAGKMELHQESFDIDTIISFVRKTTFSLVEKKGQKLEVTVAENLPSMYADPGKIKQLLINLVGNAIKFTPEGGKITIEAGFRDKYFSISVADTGIGIRPEDRERIFQEFHQAEGSTSREYGGTGLGLTLTKRLTEMHGGWIEVESEVGKGSKFTVFIPHKVEARPTSMIEERRDVRLTGKDEAPEIRMPVHGSQPLILVVEDDAKISKLISVYLTQAGYRVETAMDGEEALKKAADLQPFAITLDIMMPQRDGWEVIQELKEKPRTKDIPVIIVSMIENEELGFSLGAAGYMTKPVNREELLENLTKCTYKTRLARGDLRILAIDDDPKILEFLSMILRKEGFQVATASGGEEGIKMVLETFPDLIILDLMMPKVTGFDVIKELKKDQSARDIPIIVLTAKDLSLEEKEHLSQDVQKVVQKGGISKEDLVDEIRRLEVFHPDRAGLVDGVTGLFNQRYLLNRMTYEIHRSERYGRELSVSLVDVDMFRHYNEVNGYLQGDVVLRDMARLLDKNVRKSDIVMRYTGGKFAVIFPETKKESALSVAEKMRSLMEAYPFLHRDTQPQSKLTVSLSVVTYPSDGKETPELIQRLEEGIREAARLNGNITIDAGAMK